jgi:AraC-like DNA-binding protein
MKAKRSFEPHLVIKELTLPPGGEWPPQAPGWSCLQVTTGIAYWLHPSQNQELTPGAVVICAERGRGRVRASQVSETVIHHFRLNPDRLTGLVSHGEQQFLQHAAAREQTSVRVFRATEPVAEKFTRARDWGSVNGNASGSLFRLKLLDMFFHAFGDELSNHKPPIQVVIDAKARLKVMLNETPASELLDLDFQDLVGEMRCTPRHLSRIFHQVVGMSFREKQTQVRLVRAQELLATTDSKVLEVALESGYQSLSLFNLMFKRRFGVTPRLWREQSRNRNVLKGNQNRPRMMQA